MKTLLGILFAIMVTPTFAEVVTICDEYECKPVIIITGTNYPDPVYEPERY